MGDGCTLLQNTPVVGKVMSINCGGKRTEKKELRVKLCNESPCEISMELIKL